jgi:hypothetical protein
MTQEEIHKGPRGSKLDTHGDEMDADLYLLVPRWVETPVDNPGLVPSSAIVQLLNTPSQDHPPNMITSQFQLVSKTTPFLKQKLWKDDSCSWLQVQTENYFFIPRSRHWRIPGHLSASNPVPRSPPPPDSAPSPIKLPSFSHPPPKKKARERAWGEGT